MKGEIITLHIGQCGVQGGMAIWEQLAYEHAINPDGFSQLPAMEEDEKYEPISFFTVTSKNRFIPRTIFIDSEPSVICEIKNGLYKTLFNPEAYIHGKEEAANNFARGRFVLGGRLQDLVTERIRKEVESADLCQGFFVTHSTGGGTGSGLTIRVMEQLTNCYPKASRVQMPIFPSEYLSTAVVDPYNALLHVGFNQPYANLVTMVDNHAIMTLLSKYLQLEKPTFLKLNRLMAQIISCLFCGFHYNADPTCGTLAEMVTNLVPFPILRYTHLRYAPIVGCRRSTYQIGVNPAEELTKAVLSTSYSTLTADLASRGKMIACYFSFRGASAGCQRGLAQAIYRTKMSKQLNFVDWCPTGVKVSVHSVPAIRPVPESGIGESPANVTLLGNGSGPVNRALKVIIDQYTRLYQRRCFVHWYVGEGMEEGEFAEAEDLVKEVIDAYSKAELPQE